jgi:hypothetical protein
MIHGGRHTKLGTGPIGQAVNPGIQRTPARKVVSSAQYLSLHSGF